MRELLKCLRRNNSFDKARKIGTFLPISLLLLILHMSIQETQSILSPELLRRELPIISEQVSNIQMWRNTISSIIHGKDNRILVIVGPCSIHDIKAAIEYAGYVQKWRGEF